MPGWRTTGLGGAYPFICVFMKADYVNSHKDVTQKLVNAYVKTLKWVHTHSGAQIAAIMGLRMRWLIRATVTLWAA